MQTVTSPHRRARRGRTLVAAIAAAGLLAACSSSSDTDTAEPSPAPAPAPAPAEPDFELSRTVRFIVTYSPGGGFDTYSRGFAQVLGETYANGQSVVVDNVTPIQEGVNTIFTADADGYLIGMLPFPAAIAQEILFPDVSPWVTDEFTILGSIEENDYAVYVRSDSPYQTIADLQAGTGLRALTVEKGSSSSLAALAAIGGLGLDASLIFGAEGSAEVGAALIRGDIDFAVYGATDFTGFVESGDLSPILFLGAEESKPDVDYLRDVQTVRAAGFPELEGAVTEVRLITGPPGMSPEVEAFWKAKAAEIMFSAELQAWSETAGRPIVPRDAASAQAVVDAQIANFRANAETFRALFDAN
jgi:tripartite-type tricarboxylate transporter receptor subunit TctC